MSSQETEPQVASETFCYRHPETPTKLSCSRCGRYICGLCATPASVGQHCPECVNEAARTAPKVRSALRANAPAVMAIIGICVVVFIAQLVTSRNPPSSDITDRFGSFPPAIALGGQYYRLFTAMFLHSPNLYIHIMFNMFVLYMYGPNVEQTYGTVRFLAMYLISGFFASAVSYALGPVNALGVGASGAIFGIVGVLLVFTYNRRRTQIIASYLNNLLVFVGINLALGFFLSGIDVWAHIGGLAAGVVLGLGFDQGGRATRSTGVQIGTAALVLGAGVLLVAMRTAELTGGVPGN